MAGAATRSSNPRRSHTRNHPPRNAHLSARVSTRIACARPAGTARRPKRLQAAATSDWLLNTAILWPSYRGLRFARPAPCAIQCRSRSGPRMGLCTPLSPRPPPKAPERAATSQAQRLRRRGAGSVYGRPPTWRCGACSRSSLRRFRHSGLWSGFDRSAPSMVPRDRTVGHIKCRAPTSPKTER